MPRFPTAAHTNLEIRELEEIIYDTLDGLERTRGPGHPDTLKGYLDLGRLYTAAGLYEHAEPVFKHAMALAVASLGAEHPLTRLLQEGYASVLRKMD